MLDKIQRQTRIVEQLAKNAMTGDMKSTDCWPGNDGDDAMGVNIGDNIVNHYHEPVEPTAPPAEPTPKKMGTAAKIATTLAAATLLGPGGAGVASLLGAFDRPAANVDADTVPTVIVSPHTETE